jgi:hypothetical protein
MTMADASAMTEASGLTDSAERASDAFRGMTQGMKENPIPLAPGSERPVERLFEHLRRTTREAPLHSLAIAFLLGVLVARRR